MIAPREIIDRLQSVFDKEDLKVSPDGVSVRTDPYHLDISMSPLKFDVKIVATDDPSDSEEIITDDPAKTMAEFFSKDVPGGEFFERMSSSPQAMADGLRRLASHVAEGRHDLATTGKILRRIRASLGLDLAALGRIAASLLTLRLSNDMARAVWRSLTAERDRLKKLGWNVVEAEDKFGFPMLEVNIGDQYGATISIQDIDYQCRFKISGFPETEYEEETNDPIQTMYDWLKREDVDSARKVRQQAETVRQ